MNSAFITAYERDTESDLDFAQARMYGYSHGRFTSPDPLAASANPIRPQSWNRYSYSYNNPYKFTDSSGMIPEWVQKDGETFYDSRVVDQQSATEIYGEGATYRPNGYEFVSSERDNIELGDSGSFRRNGEIHTSEDRAKEALENQSVNTTQVPSGNGYFDFNLSFGSHGLGLTGGVMVDSNRNEFPYFGGGFMTPGFGRSVGYSPDTVSTGYNAQLQAIIGGGGSLGVDSRGNSFTEFNAGSSSASATLFFVFGGDETILPQTYSDPTGPNAGVNSPLDYNRPVRRNCACNPMP